jgi:hypothetical protein
MHQVQKLFEAVVVSEGFCFLLVSQQKAKQRRQQLEREENATPLPLTFPQAYLLSEKLWLL